MHAAHDIPSPAIRSSAEVDLRLISALNQRLGLARLSADEREIVLSNLIAGLSTSSKAHASDWRQLSWPLGVNYSGR